MNASSVATCAPTAAAVHFKSLREFQGFNFRSPRIPTLSNYHKLFSASLLELMPGLLGRVRPALVAFSNSRPLPHFLRVQFFSECPNNSCKLADHGTRSLPARQQRRKADRITVIGPRVLCHPLGNCEPWHQSQSCVFKRSRLFGTGIAVASVNNNQAHEDVSSCASGSYKTLAQPCSLTLEVKRSRFIASAISVDDEAAALSFLSQVRDSSASHNCWAFKIGDRTRFSDDGEPGGTAGRPMLTAITASGIDRVMVVVTRFFGGTKLGTGGLVRAYGKVTTDCLKDVETVIIKAKVSCKIRAPYDVLGFLYSLLETYGVEKLEENFDTEGEGGVTMHLMVDAENLQLFVKDLELTSKGRASLSDVTTRGRT